MWGTENVFAWGSENDESEVPKKIAKTGGNRLNYSGPINIVRH
jgi:hypothetical protein